LTALGVILKYSSTRALGDDDDDDDDDDDEAGDGLLGLLSGRLAAEV